MIELERKFYIFKVTEYWFNLKNKTQQFNLFTSFCFIKKKIKKRFYVAEINYTVEIDLSIDEKEIVKKFRPTLQRNIKKAKEMNMTCVFKKDIDTFYSHFVSFAKRKNIFCPSKLFLASLGNSFMTSFVYYQDELLAAHSYIIDKETGITRLFQSGSKRLEMLSNKNEISYANKLLMQEDILYFKKEGFLVYDFGGYSIDKKNNSLQGINDFKISFGGTIQQIYNYHSVLYYFIKYITSKIDRRFD